jgi:hypothetical protein
VTPGGTSANIGGASDVAAGKVFDAEYASGLAEWVSREAADEFFVAGCAAAGRMDLKNGKIFTRATCR